MSAFTLGRIGRMLQTRRLAPTSHWSRWRRRVLSAVAVGGALAAVAAPALWASAPSAADPSVPAGLLPGPGGLSGLPGPAVPSTLLNPDGLGVQPGKVKHVWLIILENKSFDATFTGLNKNTYLWQTLPSQGALLKNYFGTGHFSLDNYISLVSGQATQPDTQADCPFYDQFTGHVTPQGPCSRTRTTARSRPPTGPTPQPAPTAAYTRRACRRSSTSWTQPCELEGLQPGPGQPRREWADARRRHRILRRALRDTRPDGEHRTAESR